MNFFRDYMSVPMIMKYIISYLALACDCSYSIIQSMTMTMISWDPCGWVCKAALKGDLETVECGVARGFKKWKTLVKCASYGGYIHILEFVADTIGSEKIDWDTVASRAAFKDHTKILDYARSHGALDRHCWMKRAARGGQTTLLERLATEGRTDWNRYVVQAARGGHFETMVYAHGKHNGVFPINWDLCVRWCAINGNMDIIEYATSNIHHDVDWNLYMRLGARFGHKHIVTFAVKRGATSWNRCMEEAAQEGHTDIVEYAIENGADKWVDCIHGAKVRRQHAMVDFLKHRESQANNRKK